MEASSLRDRKAARNALNDVALGGGEGAVDVMESKKFWKLDEFSWKMTFRSYHWNKGQIY